MIPPPPRATLFPYTTLFRSRPQGPALTIGICARAGPSGQSSPAPQAGVLAAMAPTEDSSPWPDRKSTRLNSSHLGISYAVFCLKKKKTEQEPDQDDVIQRDR